MKKVLTIVIAGLIGIICFGQTPIKKVEKFTNGKIEHEYYVIEYKKIDQTYHTTDITHRQVGGTSTKLYLRHGSEKLYWDNGNMRIETNYYKNLYNGTYKRYHYNGKIAEEGTWSYGTRKDVHKFYDSNGKLREEIDFSNSNDYTKGTYKLFDADGKIIANGKLQQNYYSKAPDKKDSELALIHGESGYAEIIELTVYDNEGNKTFYAKFSETHPLRIYRHKEHPESFKNLLAILKFMKYENATFEKYQLYTETDKFIVDYTASLDKNNNPINFKYQVYDGAGKLRLFSTVDSIQSGSALYDENGIMIVESPTIIEPFATTYERFLWDVGKIVNIDYDDFFKRIIHQKKNSWKLENTNHYYPNEKIYQQIRIITDKQTVKITTFENDGTTVIDDREVKNTDKFLDEFSEKYIGIKNKIAYINFISEEQYAIKEGHYLQANNDKLKMFDSKFSEIDKKYIKEISLGDETIYKKKYKHLYNAYELYKLDLIDKINTAKDEQDKSKYINALNELLDKMIELGDKNNNELNKSLKNVIDISLIIKLLEL